MDFDKIIEEKWSGPPTGRFVTVEGCMLPERYLELKAEFDNLEVRDDDIFVCCVPKSGTTWIQEMVWLILHNLDFEGARENIATRSPYLELMMAFDFRSVKHVTGYDSVVKKLENSLVDIKKRQDHTCIKTHLPWHLQPLQIRKGVKKPKMIYVARDPRDVCVSSYHYCKITHKFSVSFDEFVQLFLAGKVYYGPYWDNVLPFWQRRHESNVLFLRYEDMKTDLKKVIREVANFLQRSLDEEDVEKLSKHLSFESMKANPAVNYQGALAVTKELLGLEETGRFMRKGIIGDYKNAMSEKAIAEFDEWIAKNTKETDYVV